MDNMFYVALIFRHWPPPLEVELQPNINIMLNVAPVNVQQLMQETSVGYLPAYDSLEALQKEHGAEAQHIVMQRAVRDV